VRWTYNQAVEHINSIPGYRLPSQTSFFDDMRARFIKHEGLEAMNTDAARAAKDVHTDIRDEALRDLYKGIGSNLAKLAAQPKGKRKGFTMQFRSKKADQESLVVRAKHWGIKSGMLASVWGADKLASAEPLPATLDYDSRLTVDRQGRWTLCMPLLPIQRSQIANEAKEPRIIALDPGCRKFMTGYDPEGAIYEWGSHDDKRLLLMCASADRLMRKARSATLEPWRVPQSEPVTVSRAKSKLRARRHHLRRAALRAFDKIRNRVKDLHHKLSKWLCANYETVLLPKFETKGMTERGRNGKRRLRSKTARSMYTWSHYSFRQRLQHKASEFVGCQVVLVTEEYTSKTCGCCGERSESLGGSEVFRCSACGVEADRDANGARNILLKWQSRDDLP
jgi:putative transposase